VVTWTVCRPCDACLCYLAIDACLCYFAISSVGCVLAALVLFGSDFAGSHERILCEIVGYHLTFT
jgi:hypothetical protein